MPASSYSYGTPLTIADFQQPGSVSVPSFQQFAGTSLPSLLDTLANLKIRVQEPGLRESGRQFDLTNALNAQIAGQQYNLGAGQLNNELTLGQGRLANELTLANLMDQLERSRLGESGRQFDVTSGLTKDQQDFAQSVIAENQRRQQEQYNYLLSLMGNPNTTAAALKALTGYDAPADSANRFTPLNSAEGMIKLREYQYSPHSGELQYTYPNIGTWPT